jgi:hypothetical protein
MNIPHRIRNGRQEWNRVPEGYRPLRGNETIEPGDVMRMHDTWYSEYRKGLLIGTCPVGTDWYRLDAPAEREPLRLVAIGNFEDGHFKLATSEGQPISNSVLNWRLLNPLDPENSDIAFEVVFKVSKIRGKND